MTGKEICQMLKTIRQRIADQYGLNYQPEECNHQGNCAGTCPRCDAELKDLEAQLEAKGISKIEIDTRINETIKQFKDEYLRCLEEHQ